MVSTRRRLDCLRNRSTFGPRWPHLKEAIPLLTYDVFKNQVPTNNEGHNFAYGHKHYLPLSNFAYHKKESMSKKTNSTRFRMRLTVSPAKIEAMAAKRNEKTTAGPASDLATCPANT
uniref:Uncharacterized protein n=1 Tax=Romanomermis culicivorax TaxID=13658 RepID=A0A915II10_ROMCU